MFNPFKKRDKQPAPQWMTWLIVLFVVYAMLSHRGPEGKNAQDFKLPEQYNFTGYNELIFPNQNRLLRIKDTVPGKGDPIVCGQEVRLAYSAYRAGEATAFETRDAKDPLVFRWGSESAPDMFSQAVVGMAEGGERSVIQPVKDGPEIRYDLTLLAASPRLPAARENPFRIMDTKHGLNNAIQCGAPAKVSLIIWSLSGKKLYETKEPLTFTPGRSSVFMGLEQAVIGMKSGGTRTLILPPDYQKTLHGNKPSLDFPFPKNETVLVDIEAMQ